ncbi:efflux RND transporter periplasmic adaptor subunit [Bradyrhizobium cenepequi]|jgi:RND family efflux transporter MFP subunit
MKYLANIGQVVLTLTAATAAAFVAYGLWDYHMNAPWTRDAHVRADVVQVAPDVSGLVEQVLVKDNGVVHQGDVLFRVDRNRFQIAEKQAEAALAGRQAATDQAKRELARVQGLKEFASRQRVEQAATTADQADAAFQQALADLALAKLNLVRSEVRASVNGTISNLSLQPGDYVSTGKSVMALINTDSIRVEGYFEETKLPRVRVGDRVSIWLMGRAGVLYGNVESIAGGIEDRERTDSSGLLANVNPTFTWVRLAQRIPVRIKIDASSSEARLVVGQTATVQIKENE